MSVKKLLSQMDVLEWMIADAVNAQSNKSELMRTLQHDSHRLNTMSRIAADWPAKLRDFSLPFSVHVELYGMNTKDKKKWLSVAKSERLTAVELRKRIRKSNTSKVSETTPMDVRIDAKIKKEFYAKKS